MALISRVQLQIGHESIIAHPDFDKPWCKELLANPGIEWRSKRYEGTDPETVSNSFFESTLYSERGIRAHLAFRRPTKEPESIKPLEECFLISVGDGLDGKTGRAHGGLSAIILDHISGHGAHFASPKPISPATATLTVDYHQPVQTPCVILARAWIVEYTGRKVWVKGLIEDGQGKVFARSKCLFILAKTAML